MEMGKDENGTEYYRFHPSPTSAWCRSCSSHSPNYLILPTAFLSHHNTAPGVTKPSHWDRLKPFCLLLSVPSCSAWWERNFGSLIVTLPTRTG
ncbi:hypothetical protein AV530_001549 [Patagioenas fasciata monilis]|uniref:Uncharacterized protein n=1 Tax=Patagioenas fasciata monilis TaxID=372326 RepID=A0A1V4KR55_PATFA|nr:hypothetical protein AV530_001549 [Patagioenas fasciata monilis]